MPSRTSKKKSFWVSALAVSKAAVSPSPEKHRDSTAGSLVREVGLFWTGIGHKHRNIDQPLLVASLQSPNSTKEVFTHIFSSPFDSSIFTLVEVDFAALNNWLNTLMWKLFPLGCLSGGIGHYSSFYCQCPGPHGGCSQDSTSQRCRAWMWLSCDCRGWAACQWHIDYELWMHTVCESCLSMPLVGDNKKG